MDKKQYWSPFNIEKVKGTFEKREYSHSESYHHSVTRFLIMNVDGIHGSMQ